MCQFSVRVGAHVRGRATMAARAGARRLLSGAASLASPAVNELKAIKVDNRGNAWRVGVRVGGGHGLLAALHARDAPLLERTGSFGDTPATLTSRPGMLIARFQPFSAVIGDNCALLMDAHRASPKAAAGAIASAVSGRGRPAPPLVSAVGAAQSVDMDAGAHARISAPPDADADDAVDDFLRALECVLDEATGYYHQKMRRLKLLTDYCLETITDELKTPGWGPGMAEAGFQRLLPLRRAMTELESDVREAHHAISDAMRSDERVDTLLPPPSRAAYGADRGDAKRDAERGADGIRERGADGVRESVDSVAAERRRAAVLGLLQTHLWRVRAAGGQLSEMSRQVEATREVWELYLDGVRNRTVRLNLQATIATLALTTMAVPASLAGMNIPNGFEAAPPALFWTVTGALAASSAAVWWSFMSRSAGSGGESAGARVDDLKALRFVLQSMDDLDDVMRARASRDGDARPERDNDDVEVSVPRVRTKEELLRALGESRVLPPGGGPRLAAQVNGLEPAALNLLFRVFDRDGDGRIDPAREWIIRPWPVVERAGDA